MSGLRYQDEGCHLKTMLGEWSICIKKLNPMRYTSRNDVLSVSPLQNGHAREHDFQLGAMHVYALW